MHEDLDSESSSASSSLQEISLQHCRCQAPRMPIEGHGARLQRHAARLRALRSVATPILGPGYRENKLGRRKRASRTPKQKLRTHLTKRPGEKMAGWCGTSPAAGGRALCGTTTATSSLLLLTVFGALARQMLLWLRQTPKVQALSDKPLQVTVRRGNHESYS